MSSFPERMRDLVGDRDPISILRETQAELASLAVTYPSELLRKRPFKGKWTPNEILGHLADNELVMCVRIKTLLFDDNPVIAGYAQDSWVARQEHNQLEPQRHVTEFARYRSENLRMWQSMSEAERQKPYQRIERGEELVGQMLVMHAGHDLSHLDQIQRYIVATSDL